MDSMIHTKLNTKTARRIIAGFLAIAVLMFLLLSFHLIAHEEFHECTGDDCPICALVQIAKTGLRELLGSTPIIAAFSAIIIFSMIAHICTKDAYTISTLVSKKIRLNN